MITQEQLKALFDYDPTDGWFVNRIDRGPRAMAGTVAGCVTAKGYIEIKINGKPYRAHNLAWLYVYGVWPALLDHIDRDPSNNKIDNLREATTTQNNHNSERAVGTSGLRGAYFDRRTSHWYSQIKVQDQIVWLGTFSSAKEAHEAFEVAAKLHQGEFYFSRMNSDLGVL